jgi:hypothetical protein
MRIVIFICKLGIVLCISQIYYVLMRIFIWMGRHAWTPIQCLFYALHIKKINIINTVYSKTDLNLVQLLKIFAWSQSVVSFFILNLKEVAINNNKSKSYHASLSTCLKVTLFPSFVQFVEFIHPICFSCSLSLLIIC